MKHLTRIRQTLGIAKSQLARELGISPIGVARLERSEDPRWSTIQRYARALTSLGNREVVAELEVSVGEQPGRPSFGAVDPADRRSAWRVRAWDDPALTSRLLGAGFVALGGAEMAHSLTHWPGRDELAAELAEAMPERTGQAISLFVTYWESFVQQMSPGDVMVLPTEGSTVAIGQITGPYEFHPDDLEPRTRHRRPIDWVGLYVPRRDIDDDLRRVINAPGTLSAIRKPDAAARLLVHAA